MLLRHQASEERDEHIDMTPMVDVVFQLMTFMLFSMQLTGGEEVDIPVAKHGVGVEKDSATVIRMLKPATPGGESRAMLDENGKGSWKPATPDQIRAAVAKGLKAGQRKVVLQADGAVPHGEVLKLAGVVTEAEGVTLHIGVQEPQR